MPSRSTPFRPSDGSRDILAALQSQHEKVRVFLQLHNMGKGAALRRGIQEKNDFVVIQDADLKYDPADCTTLLDPLIQGKADVVYGSRFLGGGPHRVLYFWHSVENWLLTLLSNCLTNIKRIAYRFGALQMKIVSQRREQAEWGYNSCRFRVQIRKSRFT